MKNLLSTICLVSLLCSCSPKPPADTRLEMASPHYSAAYRAPAFQNDTRKESIKKIAPELRKLITDYAKTKNIPGVAYGIVVDDQLVVADATGWSNLEQEIPATPSSSFRIASMTKSFTAMAILKLRDEGQLALSDPVSRYIPELSKAEYLTRDAPTIDIENLLTMTAGLPEDNPWGDRQLHEPEQMLIDLIQQGLSFSNTPSYAFEYSNTGYAMLGLIISRLTGMPYQDYISTNLLQPLGMEQTYWEYDEVPDPQLAIGYRWEDEQWKLEPMLHDGSFGAMGGLITSIEDFSKYVSYQLSAWPPGNEEEKGPVKRSSLRAMQTPQFSRMYTSARNFNGEECPVISGYGYGLGIAEDCNGLKRVSHGGALPGFGSNYIFFPEYGVGIMAFCNLTYTTPWPLAEVGQLLFETARLKPRQLPVSDILLERQQQIIQLIQQWDPDLEARILAENFYLDTSRDRRRKEAQEIFEKAGPVLETGALEPENQLRGSFELTAEHGTITVFFTLTPEHQPKVQQLDLSFQLKASE